MMNQESVLRKHDQKKSPEPLLSGDMAYLAEFHPGSQQKGPGCRPCDATSHPGTGLVTLSCLPPN